MLIRILIIISFLICAIGSCDYTYYQQGKSLFESNCAACHMVDGSGVSKLYPSLNEFKNSDFDVRSIGCIIKYGKKSEGSVIEMAALPHLSEVEIHNIVNYIIVDLNKMKHEVSIKEINELILDCNLGE